MSVFAYGRMVRRERVPTRVTKRRTAAGDEEEIKTDETDKLVEAVAALIPTEVLAAHAYLVAKWTTTDDAGTTTITNAAALGLSLPVLLAATIVAYLIARTTDNWKQPEDTLRLLIPPLAFLAWTALLGTSALTPWVVQIGAAVAAITPELVVLVAVAIGIVLVVVNARLSPKTN